jgi:hypothetical protein
VLRLAENHLAMMSQRDKTLPGSGTSCGKNLEGNTPGFIVLRSWITCPAFSFQFPPPQFLKC